MHYSGEVPGRSAPWARTNHEEGPIEAQARTTENKPTFTLNNRRDTKTVQGRRQTVRAAKEMSRQGGPTQVKRADGVVNMTFQGGTLVKYKYEPKRRRR